MAHLYTYNSFLGLSTGISLNIGTPLPSNPLRIAPPHLMIDSAGFIAVNTRWNQPQIINGRLLRSSLTTIDPANGKSFVVFDAPRQDDDCHALIHFDTRMPKGYKRRPESDINAWMGYRGEGFEVIKIDYSTGAAFLRCEANATIEQFQFDGSVQKILVANGKVSTMSLTQKQMAQLRVEQFEEEVATLELSIEANVRRFHGIIGGALRLVSVVKDKAALDVLVDFFTEYQVNLTDNLRKQIRWALTDVGHKAAGTFLDGFEATNVVRIQSSDGAAKRAAAEKRKRDRAQRDRDVRTAMRGGNSGGSSKQPSQSKKGKGKK